MASTGKRKTTMAKLNRERRLMERRQEKEIRKNARKRAAAEGTPVDAEPEIDDTLAADLARVDEMFAGPKPGGAQ